MTPEALSEELVEVVRDFVRGEMRALGPPQVDVAIAPDHDGDPSIQVDATYPESRHPVDPKMLAGLVTKLRNRLWEKGEHRFPYIRHHFPENQKVVGFK